MGNTSTLAGGAEYEYGSYWLYSLKEDTSALVKVSNRSDRLCSYLTGVPAGDTCKIWRWYRTGKYHFGNFTKWRKIDNQENWLSVMHADSLRSWGYTSTLAGWPDQCQGYWSSIDWFISIRDTSSLAKVSFWSVEWMQYFSHKLFP